MKVMKAYEVKQEEEWAISSFINHTCTIRDSTFSPPDPPPLST
jgi:hypothetical protein